MSMSKFVKKFLFILAIFSFFNYSYADKPWGDAYVEKLKLEHIGYKCVNGNEIEK